MYRQASHGEQSGSRLAPERGMYIALLLGLVGAAVALGAWGYRRGSRWRVGAALALAAGTIGFFSLLSVWGDVLWFEAVGYQDRFWTLFLARLGAAGAGAVVGFSVIFLLLAPSTSADRAPAGRSYREAIREAGAEGVPLPDARLLATPGATRWAAGFGALVGAMAGYGGTETILRYLYGVSTGVRDPIFGQDTGFYLFSLPFYRSLYVLLLALTVIALLAAAGRVWLASAGSGRVGAGGPGTGERSRRLRAVFVPAAAVLFVYAFGRYLDIYRLMLSEGGIVTGPGWTDVHVRQPVYWGLAAISVALGAAFLVPPARAWLYRRAERSRATSGVPLLAAAGVPIALLLSLAVAGLAVAPGLSQWLYVQPNEITVERPYMENGIRFTRMGFDLAKVERRSFSYTGEFTREVAEDNRDLFSEIRLWDWRALDAVYKQFQEIRLYYEFVSLDVDRYTIGDQYRQVLVAAREMNQGNLPPQNQTFVNSRFKYTHGFGITMAPVNEFTPEGLPDLLIRDIPPVSDAPGLEVERPEIYYGELTASYVVGNSTEPEFNYPRGEENVYVHYGGTGGVELRNTWRKFLFGWKFDGTRFFLSSYPRSESRVLFNRNVAERVKTIAPFLEVDPDPYVVLHNGRLYWIVDAYTTSSDYPYSERFGGEEAIETRETANAPLRTRPAAFFADRNYVRNSVKAVVDAYNGSVDLYVFEEDDPIIRVWQRIYPGVFKREDEMPAGLRAHVRYPHDLLLAQGLVYSKYHMTDPVVFYNQEDLWVRATEKYHGSVIPVAPYYIMWKPPGEGDVEFAVMLPFTPKTRQVLIGWMAGLCDGENYGRLIAYQFPKERRVLGPQQVDTKIDQDAILSQRLSLWDQRGSEVIRGNVLAIPLDETLVYVEPIYLQADTAAYPELRVVAMMHKDDLSYAETFEEALEGLVEGGVRELPGVGPDEPAATTGAGVALGADAQEAFESYLRLLGEGRFTEAAAELERLRTLLGQLADR